MFCDEPIKRVYRGSCEAIDGADAWFDNHHDLAYHVTEGYRMVLETEHWAISLDAYGVTKEAGRVQPCREGEELYPDDDPFEGYETVLFLGQHLKNVSKEGNVYFAEFDDFILKVIPHALGTIGFFALEALEKKCHWAYWPVQGCGHHLKRACHCGGEGEILVDFVWDYVVRCKNCKRSTYVDMQLRTAIENWNKGETPCQLDNILIE